MKSRLIWIFIFSSAHAIFAQMLDNTIPDQFEGRPVFNQEFIREHGIQTIRGMVFTKADHDIIRETSHSVYYKFNRFGELAFEYKTVYLDTIFTIYAYDEKSNLIIKRTADRFGFYSYHYRYDARGRIIQTDTRAQSNTGQDKYNYLPDETYHSTTDKFEYTELDNTYYKKSYLNSNGDSYREEFFQFNEKNQLIRQEGYQKSGSGKSVLEITYNEKGQMITKKATTTVMANYSTSYIYEYDSIGNILSMKYYENDIYKTEYQFVYDSETNYLKALIMRDTETQLMTIIKYDFYTFY